MKKVTNTTNADPMLTLAEVVFGGGIESQEARGQQELVNAEVLPAQGDWEALEAIGIKKGRSVDDDPLFVEATLPEGWKKKATEHSMWSMVVDETGKERASIFYKAAFYDRAAFINVCA